MCQSGLKNWLQFVHRVNRGSWKLSTKCLWHPVFLKTSGWHISTDNRIYSLKLYTCTSYIFGNPSLVPRSLDTDSTLIFSHWYFQYCKVFFKSSFYCNSHIKGAMVKSYPGTKLKYFFKTKYFLFHMSRNF